MSEPPFDLERGHRWFAAACNNRAWDLAAQPTRTAAEAREMLLAAYAAAYHWSQVGTPLNDARADVTLAHALAVQGEGAPALEHARRALAHLEADPGEDWDLAFAHLEMAHAAAVLGDRPLYERHIALAEALGEAVEDPEDQQVVLKELGRLRGLGGGGAPAA